MLTSPLSSVLAGLGTMLTAIVLFAPSRSRVRATVSAAPPREPPPVERWLPPQPELESLEPSAPQWPSLADRRAGACDAIVRLALVDGLAVLGTPWADAILRRARDDDPDPVVRSAAAAALRFQP